MSISEFTVTNAETGRRQLARFNNAPQRLLSVDGEALSKLKDLGLVDVETQPASADFMVRKEDADWNMIQSPVFHVSLTVRGCDLANRTWLKAACKIPAPLGLRRKLLLMASAAAILGMGPMPLRYMVLLATFGVAASILMEYAPGVYAWWAAIPKGVTAKLNMKTGPRLYSQMLERDAERGRLMVHYDGQYDAAPPRGDAVG